MYRISESRQNELQTAQSLWTRGDTHLSLQTYRQKAIEAYGFFDGSTQWRPEDLAVLSSRGQYPMTINLIQGKINSLCGAEIQSRIRSACRNSSGDPRMDELALALTHVLFFVQEHERMSYKGSRKFKDMLISGMGWSNIYHENGMIYYENVHPFNMIPDMDDLDPDFEKMRFAGRKRWLSPDMIVKTWPRVAQYIDFNSKDFLASQTSYSPEIMDRSSISTSYSTYTGDNTNRNLVCEIQRKVPKKAYWGIDKQGFYFETFDDDKAEEMAAAPSDIHEMSSNRIIRTLFIGDYLLETGPLDPDLPSRKDFTYIPAVWERRFSDGVPYGLLDPMKDVQRDINVRQTKAIYLQNSSRLIVKADELTPGMTPLQLENNLKKQDSVILLPKECEYELRDNAPLSEAQLKMYDKYDIILQRITGIFDDFQGAQTNASSGVAQKQRQQASIRNNVFAFDTFSEMKQREAKVILSMIQGGDYENLLSQIITEDEVQTIVLNMVREVKGKKHIFNDVRTLPLSLYIEEIPDFSSSIEENQAVLEQLMANPRADIIMSSPELLKMFKVRDYQKISDHFKESLMMANGGGQAASPSGSPSPPELMGSKNPSYPRVA